MPQSCRNAAPQSDAQQGVVPAVTAPSSVKVAETLVLQPVTESSGRLQFLRRRWFIVLVEYLFGSVGPFLHLKCSTRRKITHDGVPKQSGILTDGSRLFIIETNGTRTFRLRRRSPEVILRSFALHLQTSLRAIFLAIIRIFGG